MCLQLLHLHVYRTNPACQERMRSRQDAAVVQPLPYSFSKRAIGDENSDRVRPEMSVRASSEVFALERIAQVILGSPFRHALGTAVRTTTASGTLLRLLGSATSPESTPLEAT